MRKVPSPSEPLDLIDLKFLPAWVKEDGSTGRYAEFDEEEGQPRSRADSDRRDRGGPRDGFPRARQRRPQDGNRDRRDRERRDHHKQRPREAQKPSRDFAPRREVPAPPALPKLEVRFLPQSAALENVATQIKAGTAAYSVYALARLFLQKPERYHVRVKATDERAFFRMGESSVIGMDRVALENSAFRALKEKYYTVNVTLNEPVKGDFTSVARERTTGTLLGPTNHHGYQPQLRRFYEQHFSRRMSFTDFQRQIEIVSDPTLVEQWKEEARKVTRFTTLQEEPPQTFNAEAEAERYFREKYLPALVAETREAEIDGVTSRKLQDRGIARLIENAWSAEVRSPSNMMQELAGRLRGAGLQIFRHRKGMLFVTPIRPKAIDETAVSDSVRVVLETLKASPRMNRKDLAEKLIATNADRAEAEKTKLLLASELHWLIREGHIVEFNDGSLDLPRIKPASVAPAIPLAAAGPSGSEAALPAPVPAAVPGGNEVPAPSRTVHQDDAEELPPRTAAPTEDTEVLPPETAAATVSEQITSAEPDRGD